MSSNIRCQSGTCQGNDGEWLGNKDGFASFHCRDCGNTWTKKIEKPPANWSEPSRYPRIRAVIPILEQVFILLERGETEDGFANRCKFTFMPNRPRWELPTGRNELVEYLDREFQQEFDQHPVFWYSASPDGKSGTTKHPEFSRLGYYGRRYLAELLDVAVGEPMEPDLKPTPPSDPVYDG